MNPLSIRALGLAILSLGLTIRCSAAHGDHQQQQENPEGQLTWIEKHLQEEHHIYNFDPGAFFQLHDFDNSHTWTKDEVLRTYGLDQDDDVAAGVTEETKEHVWKIISDSMDKDHDGAITMGEFLEFIEAGNTLPDFGFGPGHHGDDEYEIHHFEKYHDENSKEEDLNHPEDIAHFKKHDDEYEAEEKQMMLEKQPVIEKNIPNKFRVQA